MTKKIRLITTFFLLLHGICSAQIYLSGYPRSGNHLLSYSMAHVLNQPVIFRHGFSPRVFILPYKYDTLSDWYLSPITVIPEGSLLVAHDTKALGLDLADQSKNFLIVIVRDYHECFIREAFQRSRSYSKIEPKKILERLSNFYKTKGKNPNSNPPYVDILQKYDQWNEKTRYLVYFEDLVTNFEETIQGCLDKFNITEHYLKDFMEHYEERMLEIKGLYRKYHKATFSEGDVHYHKKQLLTDDMAKEFDAMFRDNFPYIWEKYLKRYEVTGNY